MVKIQASLSILNSSGASLGATKKVAALVARASFSCASHSSECSFDICLCLFVSSSIYHFKLDTHILNLLFSTMVDQKTNTAVTSPLSHFSLLCCIFIEFWSVYYLRQSSTKQIFIFLILIMFQICVIAMEITHCFNFAHEILNGQN